MQIEHTLTEHKVTVCDTITINTGTVYVDVDYHAFGDEGWNITISDPNTHQVVKLVMPSSVLAELVTSLAEMMIWHTPDLEYTAIEAFVGAIRDCT